MVSSVIFSPDGRQIVSGSADKTIRVWDAHTGSQIGNHFEGHAGLISSVTFSPDARWIVSGSADKTIRVWDAHTGSQIGNHFEGHAGLISSVAFSPDGRWIASGSYDKTIRIWDAHTGSQIGSPLEGHTNYVWSVAFSPNGSWITIRLWDAYTGTQIGNPFEGHISCVTSVSFSPDGMLLLSGSMDNQIRVWKTGHHDGVKDWKDTVRVNVDGWITGPEGRLLLWIPSYYHALFYSPRNSLVIPKGGPELDLSMMVHGDKWQDCYIGRKLF
ncbi:hypothetical protein ID866_8373 [Astraeus odoratus]|nr:hypothetical protein ID866_8373 [Astraeus odoratus]